MDLLYNLETNNYKSLVYKITTQVPNLSYKIKIDIPKLSTQNTIVYVFDSLKWNNIIEIDYRENDITNNHDITRSAKINEIFGIVYKLLCT